MFSPLSGTHSIFIGGENPKKERPAVPLPTSVSFPDTESLSPKNLAVWREDDSPDFFREYAAIRKPSDVKVDHWLALNISFERAGGFEEIIPRCCEYLPPASWLLPPASELDHHRALDPDLNHKFLANGQPTPSHRDFYLRVKELLFENDEAFRALSRRTFVGQTNVRLAHFRRFWEGLENIAAYWDSSLDQYFPPKSDHEAVQGKATVGADSKLQRNPPTPDGQQPQKKAKTQPDSSVPLGTLTAPSMGNGIPIHTGGSSSSAKNGSICSPDEVPRGTYKGRRVGAGSDMPESYRIDAVRGFLEPIAWCFGFAIHPHRRQPVLQFKTLQFPLRLTGAVWQTPAERERARMGWLEGPAMAISCRNETGFDCPDADPVLDALREVCALLIIAEERHREGKPLIRPGEGQWWTTKPRWGGGPGGEVGEAKGNTDSLPSEAGQTDSGSNGGEQDQGRARMLSAGLGKNRRKLSAADVWKQLKPGLGSWDPKCEYRAIGKDRSSPYYDEVFMLSSLNHHVSVLKLRVHSAYLDYLLSGELPEHSPGLDPSWSNPTVQRTKWYDLLDVAQRAEAARGLWGVVHYLARAQ